MTRYSRFKIGLAVAATLLFAVVSPARSAQTPGQPNTSHTTRVATLGPKPSGLVVVLDTSAIKDAWVTTPLHGTPTWQAAVENPSVSGVALQIHWSDIEAVQGKPDWSTLDSLFATAEKSKKWVHLIIYPGFFSPAWALQGAQTDQFEIQYGPGKGTNMSLPMPWDTTYLNNWFAFVQQVSDRYGNLPALRLVAADGPTSVSAEFTLPSEKDVKKWRNDGYTSTKYIEAWKQVLQFYASAFPNQYISVSQGHGLNIDDKGNFKPGEGAQTQQAIVDQAAKSLGRRFALQSSNVHAGPGPHEPNSAHDDKFVIDHIGSIVTGLQMRTSAMNDSAVMGDQGHPSSALKKSIDLALQTNGAGQHVDYLEIYEPDIVAAEMQSVLRCAASVFSKSGPSCPPYLPPPATPH